MRLGSSEGRQKLGFKPGLVIASTVSVYLCSKFSSYPWLYTLYSVVTYSTFRIFSPRSSRQSRLPSVASVRAWSGFLLNSHGIT